MQFPKSALLLFVPAVADAWSFTGWDQTCEMGRSWARQGTEALWECQPIAAIRAIGPSSLQPGERIIFYKNMQECNTYNRQNSPQHFVIDVDTLALDAIDEDCLTLQFTSRAFKVLDG